MSEVAEKEVEVVAGIIGAVIQKKPDTWQVEVTPDGSKFSKKLWTKDSELVASLTAKLGQAGAFVCNASYWQNQSGAQVRSLWIHTPAEEGAVPGVVNASPSQPAPTPASVPLVNTNNSTMTKDEWARKDSAIHKMACIKTAVAALTHTMPSEPTTEQLNAFIGRVTHLSGAFHRQVLAERDDPTGEEVPF